MEYNFSAIEAKAKAFWKENDVYKTANDSNLPKYYILDMFPYPSGAGLHVGHPLGYIASDIFSRYKRMKGFNVLHPMGFDAFGLPAEQYAIETGQHPAITTAQNIERYKKQLDNIGFDYDWSRTVNTSQPEYYQWTQWLFKLLFNSWYDRKQQKARPIAELEAIFKAEGNVNHPSPAQPDFVFSNWGGFNEVERRNALMQYRLAYLDYAEVWWCEALNTVLANDEVVNGVSERGGFLVERKKMRQWFLRITEYADRLLSSLDSLEWSEAMKEMQRNWIGRSEGASIQFEVFQQEAKIEVFTTRPDTIFGVDFMVLAPEHELVAQLTTDAQQEAVGDYIAFVKSRSERERMAEKKISGVFTGAFAVHPFTQKQIPIWISEYVLAGYGTGAIMAVPAGDERDHAFAQHFNIPITNIFENKYTGTEAVSSKDVQIENSEWISGMSVKDAAAMVLERLESAGIGKSKVNFKLRDAGFSRQRYWGEPFPIVYKQQLKMAADGGVAVPYLIDELEANLPEELRTLPLTLPQVAHYEPGPAGQGPLANIESFVNVQDRVGLALKRETNTMPGYAGSSWYFLRYADPHNKNAFASKEATDYWNQVDLYIGGTEHAVGHLLYSRLWTKVLFDLGYLSFEEPFKRLLNQGMIQGSTRYVYRLNLKTAEKIIAHFFESNTNIRYEENVKVGEVTFDYYLPQYDILLDLTKNNILKQRVHSYKNSNIAAPYTNSKTLFISEIEIFDQVKQGKEHSIKWLQQLIDNKTSYQSPISDTESYFISKKYIENGEHEDYDTIRVDVNIVDGVELDISKFKDWRAEYNNAAFILEDGKYICGVETEKMSKSKYNVVNPDDIVAQYGADTFRMYEMFLGPIEMSKPWDTKGIEGVFRFLRKWVRLFYNEDGSLRLSQETPNEKELKVLHKTIKKIEEDTLRFSFNTAVSQFMICVNELSELKSTSTAILEPLVRLIAPYAPHLAESIWQDMGKEDSVVKASYPTYEEKYTVENTKVYPVAVNGKSRAEMEFDLNADEASVQAAVLGNEKIQKYMEGKPVKKFIYVKGRMINVVVG